jgi:hypothetical protein
VRQLQNPAFLPFSTPKIPETVQIGFERHSREFPVVNPVPACADRALAGNHGQSVQ